MIIAGICTEHGLWKGSKCQKCEYKAEFNVYKPFKPYFHWGLDTFVTSRRHLQETLKENNAVECGCVSAETYKYYKNRHKTFKQRED